MSAAASHTIFNSDSLATPTAQEQLLFDALFKHLFNKYSSDCSLVMVVKLVHCIANGTAVKWLRQGVPQLGILGIHNSKECFARVQHTVFDNLKNFVLEFSVVDAKRINEVHFDASGVDSWGVSCLSRWATQNDRHTTQHVTESFQLLKRSGGVTLQAALVYTKMTHNAYHCSLLSSRTDWVDCLLSEPTLNDGWSIPYDQKQTPLLSALSSNQLIASREKNSLSIMPVMSDSAINTIDEYGNTALYLAIRRPLILLLEALLMRPGLNMNPSVVTVRFALQHVLPVHRQSVVEVFNIVARRFAILPLLIHDAVYTGWQTILPIPLCTIIYQYYRTPYPRCECDPVVAAAEPNKHSPFFFCFPSK